MHTEGPKVLLDIPEQEMSFQKQTTVDDFALLDEMSGLTLFLDNFLLTHKMPEATRERIAARYLHYEGKKDKTEAMNEMRLSMYSASR